MHHYWTYFCLSRGLNHMEVLFGCLSQPENETTDLRALATRKMSWQKSVGQPGMTEPKQGEKTAPTTGSCGIETDKTQPWRVLGFETARPSACFSLGSNRGTSFWFSLSISSLDLWDHLGRQQIFVHVSMYQGKPFGATFFVDHHGHLATSFRTFDQCHLK